MSKRDDVVAFVRARHNIYLRRQRGDDKPWTDDPILMQYRFCNVYRELDAVTQWIAKNWRQPHDGDEHLWFGMTVARYVNLPDTLRMIGWPVPWKPDHFRQVARDRKAAGKNFFNAAYIISTQGRATNKIEYLCDFFGNLWSDRQLLVPNRKMTLGYYNSVLVQRPGIGRFMSGQIIADLKYANPLQHATDWDTFAASGPGSRRGMNRVLGNPVKQAWNETDWHVELMRLRNYVNKRIPQKWEQIHAQDMQNCLCEFDKYERAKYGEGRPKQKYPGDRML